MSKKIPLTQGKYAIVDDADYEWLNQWKWYARKSGRNWYVNRMTPRKNNGREMVFMHRVILDAPENKVVDHKNKNGLDNRRENLRLCSPGQNIRNSRTPRGSTTGYKGVTKRSGRKKFEVYINIGGRQKYIGCHDDPSEAARMYDRAARKYFGEFAGTNFND